MLRFLRKWLGRGKRVPPYMVYEELEDGSHQVVAVGYFSEHRRVIGRGKTATAAYLNAWNYMMRYHGSHV